MSTHLIVVENKNDWKPDFPDYPVLTAREYLSRPDLVAEKGLKVINLCRNYGYLNTGYYCSLLAEARRHRVVPTVRILSELSRKSLYTLEAGDLDDAVEKRLHKTAENSFELLLFFGECDDERLQEIGRQIFELFPCPILRVEFKRETRWRVNRIRPGYINQLQSDQYRQFVHGLESHLSKRWRSPRSKEPARYDIAMLHNPKDPLPPSNRKALQNFVRVGKSLDINVELVERKDYARLAEYDALFIRETTRIDHYTFQFARKAESEGMVVIDDPDSILKCTNKVYLAELLRANRVPHPRTAILQEGRVPDLGADLGYPVVLKIPDGSFSRGVHKATDGEAVKRITNELFRESDLLLAQEYVYTDYDWRIGILNRKPLYACRYFMSKNHWQIVNHKAGGRFTEGNYETLPVGDAPPRVVETALKAANLIGDGLYGVDLKENENGVFVIEVNDNPNLDAGVEDACLRDTLYRAILEEFVSRLEKKRQA